MPWNDLKSPVKSRQDTPIRFPNYRSREGSPVMLEVKEVANHQNMQGYTSNNPYDSYIPEDSLAGNSRSMNLFGQTKSQKNSHSVINRSTSQTL
jgi:hypothetical protein